MPMMVVAPISTVSSTMDATLWPRAMNVATVAHANPARTKNCQACRPCSDRSERSVEVSELIVEAFVQLRVDWRGFRLRVTRVFGPPDGYEAHADDSGGAEEIREKPREAIESLVDRRHEEVLPAVFLDQAGDDRVVVFARVDFFAELGAHLRGVAARAFRQRLVRAAAARAADFVTQ